MRIVIPGDRTREQAERELLWLAVDLLAQILLRSALAGNWDREQWEELVKAKKALEAR